MPEVSIIVPVYNAEKYIRRCVDSILAQIFTDFELILVDDGSTDSGGGICDEYAKKDKRVHVIHKNNGGISSARNLGIDVSIAKWIMFCDADDWVSEDWVKTLYDYAEKYSDRLVNCEFAKVSQNRSTDIIHISEYVETMQLERKDYFYLWSKGISGFVWNRIFRADLVKENKLRFNEELNAGEDAIFVTDYLLLVNCKMIYIPKCCYYWIDNDGRSASRKYNPHFFEIQEKTFWARKRIIEQYQLQGFYNNQFYYMLHGGVACAIRDNDEQYFKRIVNDLAFMEVLQNADRKTASWKLKMALHLKSFRLIKGILKINERD